MNKKLKQAVLSSTILAGLAFTLPVFAQSVALNELNTLTIENVKAYNQEKLDKSHWAYKTLQNISKNYGLAIGSSLEGNAALSRNEAAMVLVNLVGQIEKQKLTLSEAEKAKIEILEQEFGSEIDKLESDIAVLKGRVSALEDRDKKLWGFNYGEDFKITGGLQSVFYGNFDTGTTNATASNFSLPYGEVAITGKLREHLDYMFKVIPTRNLDAAQNTLLEDVYIGTDIIPHHYLTIGHTAVPFGIEAPMNPLDIDFIEFSQISRNFGQGYDTGITASGDWDWIKYNVGTYNGTGYGTTDNNREMTIASQVSFVPFYKMPKLGDLALGGSHIVGRNTANEIEGLGAHISYDIGKFGVKGEYMTIEGITASETRGNGWYVDAKYQFTDKLTMLGRLDSFNPNNNVTDDSAAEYTLGANYLFNDYLLFMLNYTYADVKDGKDSNRLGFMTQVVF